MNKKICFVTREQGTYENDFIDVVSLNRNNVIVLEPTYCIDTED